MQGAVGVKRFYARRFFKIVPHYLFVILCAMGILGLFFPHVPINYSRLIAYLTMTQNYILPPIPILEHLWSIAIEEHFYLIYPLVLLLVGALCRTRAERLRVIIFSLVFLLILGNLIRIWCYKNPGWFDHFTIQKTHFRFDALIFGCFLRFAQDWLVVQERKKFYGHVLIIGAFFGFLYLFLNGFQEKEWFHFTIAYLSSGMILAAALCGFRPILDLGNIGTLRWIGRNSYGIYLWHYILIFPFLPGMRSAQQDWKIIVMYVVLSICCGALSTATVERYFLRLRERSVP